MGNFCEIPKSILDDLSQYEPRFIEDDNEGDKILHDKCDEMMKAYLVKYNLDKSMRLTNVIEDNPISDLRIKNSEIIKDIENGNIKEEDGERMIKANNTLHNIIFDKNPMVLDEIIL